MQKKATITDPAHDLLRTEPQPLDVFFRPRTVAVIGATENPGSVGRTLLQNLIGAPFGGTVFPVNPKRPNVLGIKAYPSVSAVPDPVDLAVIVTPAATVPGIIRECAGLGVKGAIVISAGFKEAGAEGEALERQILETAKSGRMRIIGPNCLGVMSPLTGINATFAQAMARPGSVALVSQSGALLTAVLDYSLREMIGFSACISLGSMLDVGWGDLIDYLGNDPRTQSIVLYMESIGNARAFLSAAREVALTKPIIVIKAGRTELGARAAASHTGALTGSDEVLEAAFRRSGVLRVGSIADLFYMAEVLSKQPRPTGRRLTVLTNAGGPGVLAADALIAGGGELAPLSAGTMDALNQVLPPHWSHGNPVDVLGDAGPDRYAQALEIAARDPESDGLLVILTPQAMTDPTLTAERLREYGESRRKPVLASWMGGVSVAAGEAILNRAGVPVFPYPDTAARVFNYMWRYNDNLRTLYETPVAAVDPLTAEARRGQADALLDRVRASGRALLTEAESKALLDAYEIPTVETRVAETEAEAVAAAENIGYPVVLKLHSETITHKTDVQGVKLNLPSAAEVRGAFQDIREAVAARAGVEHFQGVTVQPMVRLEGYELILGSSPDPQFGPVLLFGTGGQLVEVYQDRSLALPPVTTTLARRLLERTRIFTALQGVRGRPPVDLAALERLIVRFGELVVAHPWIREIDINPLLASSERLIALDARVVLHDPATREEDLPRPAIRPYPIQYVWPWTLRNGMQVTLRPIRPEDEPLIVRFHETLSERSVYLRYFQALNLSQRVAHDRLLRICFNDYDRDLALVADYEDPSSGRREILGVGRLTRTGGRAEAEFALLVSDQYQHLGLGEELLRRLTEIARAEGLEGVSAEILVDNEPMRRLCLKLGFVLHPVPEDPRVLCARLELRERPEATESQPRAA